MLVELSEWEWLSAWAGPGEKVFMWESNLMDNWMTEKEGQVKDSGGDWKRRSEYY